MAFVRARRRPIAFLPALGLALVFASCQRQRLHVEYLPTAPPPPTFRAFVFLQVLDQRPPDRGGINPGRVGWTPGNFGIPKRMRIPADSIARNVWNATADALAHQAIGATAGPNMLVATVSEFWEDGIGGTGTHVVVRYQVIDPSGRERWAAVIRCGSGEPADPNAPPALLPRGPDAPSVDVITYALAELAARARVQFATAAFQQAVAP